MLIAAGVRILEATCGPCIGQGGAPPSNGVTVRTFNRNFAGRTGTKSAKAYLVSPEVTGACALTGVMTDPRTLGQVPVIKLNSPVVGDRMIISPLSEEVSREILPLPNVRKRFVMPAGTVLSSAAKTTVRGPAGNMRGSVLCSSALRLSLQNPLPGSIWQT